MNITMRKTALAIIVALAMLSPVLPASAATRTGQLVKGSGPAVYYVNSDSKRLVFLDLATYRTWYADFSQVQSISDAELASLPLGGTVMPRPGIAPIKFKSDSKVYALTHDGVLRRMANPSVAAMIYGSNWTKKIIVLPDTEAANYTVGNDITGPWQYMWKAERDASPTIYDVRFATAKASLIRNPSQAVLASAVTRTTLTIVPTITNAGAEGRMNANEKDFRLFIENQLVYPNVATDVKPGDYTIYYTKVPGYVASAWGGDCNQASDDQYAGYVHFNFGDHKVCTVTYAYSAEAAKLPTITVQVNVHNTNYTAHSGAIADDFIKSIGTQSAGETGVEHAMNGVAYSVTPGTYMMHISSDFARYYLQSDWGGDCNADGTVSVDLGDHKTCTIEEYDRPDKDVSNQHTMGELVLYASVPSNPSLANSVKLFIDSKQVQPFQLNEVDPRPANYGYTVYASLPNYHVSTWGGDCLPAGTVNVAVDQLKSCVATMVPN